MAWRDQVKQSASFRGIKFGLSDSEYLFGRRNILHEYPLRDIPYAEDMGKKAREFTLNAFFVGDNYVAEIDRLVAAIEDDDTPGTLTHPTWGIRKVIPKECRRKFSNVEGGIEYLTLTFVDAGSNAYPDTSSDTRFESSAASEKAVKSFEGNFDSKFDVVGKPDFVQTNAEANAQTLPDTLNDIIKSGNTNTEAYSDYQQEIAAYSAGITSTIRTPSIFSANTGTLITGLSNMYLSQNLPENQEASPFLSSVKPNHPAVRALEAQKRLQDFGEAFLAVVATTESRAQEFINQLQLINLIINISLAEMVRILSIMDFASRQDAIAFRDDVNTYIDPQLISLGDIAEDEAFTALNAIKAKMVKDINLRAATLKNIKHTKTRDSISALVFAYNQFDDATKEAEVIERNHIRNPLFINPLSMLEVLV